MSELQAMITRFRQLKIVPVIAVDNAEDIIPLGNALADNGVRQKRSNCCAKPVWICWWAREP